ncbi:MAG: hypothetical protein A2X32_01460 [Elusimicrobia bacterium GWC2_64_44]|nr:MAG: hypothetical protein A2X32_01460 [Elusimicrobia bacterium GWC2_64_44]
MHKIIISFLTLASVTPAAAQVSFESLSVSAWEIKQASAENIPQASPAKLEKLKLGLLSKAERDEYVTRATVFRPESELNTAALDFKAGPYPKMKYAPEELVTCNYIPMKDAYEGGVPNGMTRKFKCRDAKGKDFKVKYGEDNAELMTEVAASWIYTGAGIYTDRMYPVRLNCPDCPSDPFKSERDPGAWKQGQIAVIEDKLGERIEYAANSGIGFDETHLMQNRVEAEALAGLAMLFGDTDNKAENQAVACPKDEVVLEGGRAVCRRPVAYLQDMGVSFGGRSIYHNRRMHFRKWKNEDVWDNPEACIMRLNIVRTSSLREKDSTRRDMHQIGEQARQLLIRRLSLLSRSQLVDIFNAARAPQRAPEHSAEEWADLFLKKVDTLRRPLGNKTPANFACPYSVVPPNSYVQPPDPFSQYN